MLSTSEDGSSDPSHMMMKDVIDLTNDGEIRIRDDRTNIPANDKIIDLTSDDVIAIVDDHASQADQSGAEQTEKSATETLNTPVTSLRPAYLFRVSSKESNGTNSPTAFRLSRGVSLITPKKCQTPESDGEKLKLALLGRHFDNIPFIFFTSSLLFAIQLAAWMEAEGRTEVRITCVCTETATTPDGVPATFYSVQQLMKKWAVDMRHKYSGEYISMSDIILGQGSCFVCLDTLIREGLYCLYPELCEVNNRRRVKWYSAVRELRKYCFEREFVLSEEEIDVAARLAIHVRPCTERAQGLDTVVVHLLACFLGLRKRDKNDAALHNWLQLHTVEKSTESRLCNTTADVGTSEVENSDEISDKMAGREISVNSLQPRLAICKKVTSQWKSAWIMWSRERREAWRVNGPKRSHNPTRNDHGPRHSVRGRRSTDTFKKYERRRR